MNYQPPYPPVFSPRPLTGIGQFMIGEGSLGTPPWDYTQTILAQYANSPIIQEFICNYSQSIDQNQNLDNFYDMVWNLSTAQGYGLDVWGRIVGVTRYLTISEASYVSFEESGGNSTTQAYNTLYSGGGISMTYALTDAAFLQLILAKAAANIWSGSIPALNAILRLLFPGQVAYCTDGLNMTMTYTFGFVLSPVQYAIVSLPNLLPRPAGVSTSIVQL